MTAFSPDWLALREPADRAARNRDVLNACARAFAGRDQITVCDLGAGTGASIRAFAGLLPSLQHWTLVDYDARNLTAAASALTAWADAASQEGDALILRHGARRLEVRTRIHDLARDPAGWPADADLVTTSAFVDLTSAAWIERFVAALAATKTAVLSTLTVNGVIVPEPMHPLDQNVVAGFHAHQGSDKGFGPSAGPAGALLLERALQKAGYSLTAGDSPWVLDRSQADLVRTTLNDIGAAVAETGKLESNALADWRAAVQKAERLTVGHRDVFARMITA